MLFSSLGVIMTDESQAADVPAVAKATFGGGCFWCTEAVYAEIRGVNSVTSGYTGGRIPNPNYKQICSGLTGHAEAVEIQYDPTVVPFEKLLEIFFATHDPTTLNRQGPDFGTQYRSAIFYHDGEQKQIAEKIDWLYENRQKARELGQNGLDAYRGKNISWDKVVTTLLGEK